MGAERDDLGTFGAVLRFAIQEEEEAGRFYQEAATQAASSPAARTFEEMAEEHRVARGTLERLRREEVAEMILEPIRGLSATSYHTPSTAGRVAGQLQSLAAAREEDLRRFYADAGLKLAFLPQVRRALQRLAQGAEARLSRLGHNPG
ncbi:MAG: hypothetical protein HYY00_08365 [Chloroflexi bacterium]|nr:hypothetical protein [Chloroflexota bacterium]